MNRITVRLFITLRGGMSAAVPIDCNRRNPKPEERHPLRTAEMPGLV
jgi:hypothetical protein